MAVMAVMARSARSARERRTRSVRANRATLVRVVSDVEPRGSGDVDRVSGHGQVGGFLDDKALDKCTVGALDLLFDDGPLFKRVGDDDCTDLGA